MSETFDLFGDPVPANWGQRGRPEHIPTQGNRNRVSMLVALGWSNRRIAASMFVTLPTLRKHYFSELKYRDVARDRLNANLATRLFALFMEGNVAAGREFRAFLEHNDLMLNGHIGAPAPMERSKERKLGKKETALAAARNPDHGSALGALMALRQRSESLPN